MYLYDLYTSKNSLNPNISKYQCRFLNNVGLKYLIIFKEKNIFILGNMRGKVAEHFVDHVMEGGKILVHGESRVVQEALCHAAKSGKDFEVS